MLPNGPDATPHEAGGRLCLGMVNSVIWRRSDAPIETVDGYPDLAWLAGRAGWLPRGALAAAEAAHPAAAARALDRALTLREGLYPLFSAVAAGQRPAAADLALLNESLAEALGRLTVVATDEGGFEARWPDPAADPTGRDPGLLDLPRWQVAASAGALLTSAERDRIKQCPGERCGWVFVDASRNRSRRWCDSRECGNRERVRAHYHRTRSVGGPA